MNEPSLKDRIWRELKKFGIHDEKELDQELAKLELINISCFTIPLNEREVVIDEK
ncbi:MAG: hypothetical protein HFJ53_01990 [Clostridia bacterium]|jgi:hypothetical protein|nr:hypothetical protein [Clostridia bacterium]